MTSTIRRSRRLPRCWPAVRIFGTAADGQVWGGSPLHRVDWCRQLDDTAELGMAIIEEEKLVDFLDIPAHLQFVATEMQFGLGLAIERDRFYGDRTDAHLHGIAQKSGVPAVAFDADLFRTTHKAITAVTTLGYVPAVFVLGPSELEEIDPAVTSGSGEFANKVGPFDLAEQKLWGTPVMISTQFDTGDGFLGVVGGPRQTRRHRQVPVAQRRSGRVRTRQTRDPPRRPVPVMRGPDHAASEEDYSCQPITLIPPELIPPEWSL